MPVALLAGSKGGVGCTTVAVNLAVCAASVSKRVLLIDAADRNDCAVLCGVERFRALSDVRAQWAHVRGESLYGYLTVGSHGISGVRWDGDAGLVRELCARYDMVVIDAGTRWRETRALWACVTHWGCVLVPDVCALHGVDDVLAVWRDCFIAKSRVAMCVNQWTSQAAMTPATLAERCAGSPQFFLAHEAELVAAAIDGVPLITRRTAASFGHAVREMAQTWWAWPDTVAGLEHASADAALMPANDGASTTSAPGDISIALRSAVLADLHRRLDGQPQTDDAEVLVRRTLHEVIAEWPVTELRGIDRAQLVEIVLREAIGLGPLEALCADDDVSEILVNGPAEIFCERGGRLERVACAFRDLPHLQQVIQRLLRATGRRVDLQSPIVDARLSDGSRLNVVLPPLTLHSPALTIRRFGRTPWTLARWCERGSLDPGMAELLSEAVRTRRSLLLIGGTGSGKTTLLNALSAAIPEDERIVTIEDAAELQLQQPHVVTLQARPANLEGEGAITIRDLVRTALRMRPDRIIVGECRGAEALDMLQAMNTGHEGALTTLHANSPAEAMARLATLVCFAGFDLPPAVVYAQIASAIDLVVQVIRNSDGHRRVAQVCEVVGCEGMQVELRSLDDHAGAPS